MSKICEKDSFGNKKLIKRPKMTNENKSNRGNVLYEALRGIAMCKH